MDHSPEISDLIVDFDPDTGVRRRVRKADVEAAFGGLRQRRALRVVRSGGWGVG